MNNYIKPNISIVRISNQQILAGSGPEVTDTVFDPEDGLAKGGGMLWDEDEDDDPMGAPTFDVWEE